MISIENAENWRKIARDYRDGKSAVHPANIAGVLIEVLDDLATLRVRPGLPEDFIRGAVLAGLYGHDRDSFNQDSGDHCKCGSDSRFHQNSRGTDEVDLPWSTINEHRAQSVILALRRAGVIE